MGKIKKGPNPPENTRIHKQRDIPDNLLRFSFRHFIHNDKFDHNLSENHDEYITALLGRLRDVSSFTIKEFRTRKGPPLLAHQHDWAKTSEPEGYQHLTPQLQQCEPWQFCLTRNEHGRVHGILIDDIFYIVWLDPKHSLYPQKS